MSIEIKVYGRTLKLNCQNEIKIYKILERKYRKHYVKDIDARLMAVVSLYRIRRWRKEQLK